MIAALLLMGFDAAVPTDFLASLPREELLNNVVALRSMPAIIVPCGVGVDPLTSGLTVQYHGTGGVECDFKVTATYEVWYGGAWEASEERTTALTDFKQYRCGDLFPDLSPEEAGASCRKWAHGMTMALASVGSPIAVQPEITADTSVFVYDLESNGLPTFAGIDNGILAARVSDFDTADLPEIDLPEEDNATYVTLWESIVQNFAPTGARPTSASPWTTTTTTTSKLMTRLRSCLAPELSPFSVSQSAWAPLSPLSTQKPHTGVRTAQRPGLA